MEVDQAEVDHFSRHQQHLMSFAQSNNNGNGNGNSNGNGNGNNNGNGNGNSNGYNGNGNSGNGDSNGNSDDNGNADSGNGNGNSGNGNGNNGNGNGNNGNGNGNNGNGNGNNGNGNGNNGNNGNGNNGNGNGNNGNGNGNGNNGNNGKGNGKVKGPFKGDGIDHHDWNKGSAKEFGYLPNCCGYRFRSPSLPTVTLPVLTAAQRTSRAAVFGQNPVVGANGDALDGATNARWASFGGKSPSACTGSLFQVWDANQSNWTQIVRGVDLQRLFYLTSGRFLTLNLTLMNTLPFDPHSVDSPLRGALSRLAIGCASGIATPMPLSCLQFTIDLPYFPAVAPWSAADTESEAQWITARGFCLESMTYSHGRYQNGVLHDQGINKRTFLRTAASEGVCRFNIPASLDLDVVVTGEFNASVYVNGELHGTVAPTSVSRRNATSSALPTLTFDHSANMRMVQGAYQVKIVVPLPRLNATTTLRPAILAAGAM